MKELKLKESGVILDGDHNYSLNGKKLQGITALISKKIAPDQYKFVDKDYLASKAEVGKNIHEAIALSDDFNLSTDDYKNIINEWEILKAERNIKSEMSEYIVTDFEQYASPIDKVVTIDDKIYLVDIKTTSALNKEYCAWQLSIYKYLFEKQNEGLKVEGLLVLHIKKDFSLRLVEVTDKGEQACRDMLYTAELPAVVEIDNTQALELIKGIAELMKEKEELESKIKAFDDNIKAMVKDLPPFKFENEFFTLSKGEDYERTTLDSKRLKADKPDIYREYEKTSKIAGRITYALK